MVLSLYSTLKPRFTSGTPDSPQIPFLGAYHVYRDRYTRPVSWAHAVDLLRGEARFRVAEAGDICVPFSSGGLSLGVGRFHRWGEGWFLLATLCCFCALAVTCKGSHLGGDGQRSPQLSRRWCSCLGTDGTSVAGLPLNRPEGGDDCHGRGTAMISTFSSVTGGPRAGGSQDDAYDGTARHTCTAAVAGRQRRKQSRRKSRLTTWQ
jgi:hypothetical protein